MTETSLSTQTRYGLMTILSNPGDIVSRFLAQYGEWSEFEIEFIARNLPKQARVADVGAFVGSFGIGLSQLVDLEEVCFVEANPDVVPLLHQNVERNCRTTYSFVDAPVYPKGRKVELVRRSGDNQGSTSFDPDGEGEIALDAAVPERTVSLQDLLREHGPFNLLKLDIEGLEHDVIEDIATELAGGMLSLWAECNEAPGSLDLAELLLSSGLRVHYFAYPSFNPGNFRGEAEAIFPMAYEAGLYASRDTPTVSEKLVQAGCLLYEITGRDSLKRALWRTPRWCPPSLLADRAEESLAIAVRHLTGEQFTTFLGARDRSGLGTPPPVREIATLLAVTESLERVQDDLKRCTEARDHLQRAIDEGAVRLTQECALLATSRDEISELNRTRGRQDETHAAAIAQLTSQAVREREQLRQLLDESDARLQQERVASADARNEVSDLKRGLSRQSQAHVKAVDRLTSQIALEREQRDHHGRLAEWAQALAHDRLQLLKVERMDHLEWRQNAAEAEQRAVEATRRLDQVLARLSSRAMNAVVRPLVRSPRLYRVARVGWSAARRIARYLRFRR